MPLDLVGKLHRTVYISNIDADVVEDLVRLLLARCGAVEAWDYVGERGIVVFESMNSMSTALAFNGMTFVDLTKPIVIWKASDPPPAEANTQMSISGKETTDTEASNAVDLKDLEERKAMRQQRMEVLKNLSAGAVADDFSEENTRNKKLDELSYRQLKALVILTEAALVRKQKELEKNC